MKTIKVSEATSVQLDWLVGRVQDDRYYGIKDWLEQRRFDFDGRYTTDWSQMGPIIDQGKIEFRAANKGMYASYPGGTTYHGENHLTAAARCYVVSKMGETAEVPEELL